MSINFRDLILPLEVSGKNLGNCGLARGQDARLMGHVVGVPIEYDPESSGSNYSVTPRLTLPGVAMRLRRNTSSSIFGIHVERGFADAHDVLPGSRANINTFKGNDISTGAVEVKLTMNI
jgi:hypothetical protein